MSRFHKSTKMGFPRNPPKMFEFHENRKLSEMVVRGWYMTHFDRRDLQKSKKLFWGRFRITSDFSGPICEISWLFHYFHRISHALKNRFFWLSSPEKWSKMFIFWYFFWFFSKLWYISSILIFLHCPYLKYIKSSLFLKSRSTVFPTNVYFPILKTSHILKMLMRMMWRI